MQCKREFVGLEPFYPETIRALIVDNIHAVEELTQILSTDPVLSITSTTKLDDIEDKLEKIKPDILFIDPAIDRWKGMQLVDKLIAQDNYPEIILMIKPSSNGIDKQIRTKVMAMLVKPFSNKEIHGAIRDYLNMRSRLSMMSGMNRIISGEKDKKFKFSTRKGHVFLSASEIIYCKAQSNYTHLILTGGRQITVSKSLHHFDNRVLSPHYYRISRSAIINTEYLVEISRKDKNCILQQNGEYLSLPVTQKYLKSLLDHFRGCHTLNQ
jgi:two-component system LytT family response regulator